MGSACSRPDGPVRFRCRGNGDPRRGLADRVSRMEMVFKLLAALLVVGLAVVTAVAAWK